MILNDEWRLVNDPDREATSVDVCAIRAKSAVNSINRIEKLIRRRKEQSSAEDLLRLLNTI